jgi:hypothetical protein
MRTRRVFSDAAFDSAAGRFPGGLASIDDAIAALVEALYRDPYQFELVEERYMSFRYATITAIGRLPELVVYFSIRITDEFEDVTLNHIEEFDPY